MVDESIFEGRHRFLRFWAQSDEILSTDLRTFVCVVLDEGWSLLAMAELAMAELGRSKAARWAVRWRLTNLFAFVCDSLLDRKGQW